MNGNTISASTRPTVSVLMPTFNQAAFIGLALSSLEAQTFTDWELVIVDDGATDDTALKVTAFLNDPRIRYYRLEENQGLGFALNYALEQAQGKVIAYLPSDDLYYPDHIKALLSALEAHPEAVAAYSGMRHHGNQTALGPIVDHSHSPGRVTHPLQLVQVMHRAVPVYWLERTELVTDDLDRMYWTKLACGGAFVPTGRVSCEWVDHPAQRHKIIRETGGGGINPYRSRYRVKTPLRFQSSQGNYFDELEHYRRFRERPATPLAPDGLKVLLVGELAYNPERVLAIEERGHKLYGLWTDELSWFNSVGPLPCGHVEDLPRDDWQAAVARIKPDVIYALLNWQTVPFVHKVLSADLGVPFIWHFKEGPWLCRERGSWPQLLDLHCRSDGVVYSSPELRDWFTAVVPGCVPLERTLVLDGDLPKQEWFTGERSPLLSAIDGQIHTVVPGRPIGFSPEMMGELAAAGVHVHFYGDVNHGSWRPWVEESRRTAPGYLHLHPNVPQAGWLREFSQYDAGWLHLVKSENAGDLRQAFWDDLNYPARIATLAAAGLPLLQYDNRGAVVATQNLARELDIGLFFKDMADLGTQLRDRERMHQLRDNVWRQRPLFTFDFHVDRLIGFFQQVIARRASGSDA